MSISIKRAVSACLLCAVLLCGCSSQQTEEEGLAEGQRVVDGKVTVAVGNELTVEVGTLQESGGAAGEQASPGQSGEEDISAEGISSGEPQPEAGFEEAPFGESGDGPPGMGEEGAGAMGGSPSIQLDYTGETMDLVVPVSTPVTVTVGTNTVTTDFMQVMVDDIIMIVFETYESGVEGIASIQILS